MQATGFTRITADRIINEGATLFYGVIIEASADGGDVSIYEGMDALSGRLFSTLKALANDREIGAPGSPVFFDRGLFVDVGTNVTAVTVLWVPVPSDG